MSWFETLTGFQETTPAQVREQLYLDGDRLVSRVNGKSYQFGRLEIPSLGALKSACKSLETYKGAISLREIPGEAQELHQRPEYAGATFQAASQFNLLEMISTAKTPEEGVGIYELDPTQGPACAIACGAGTIYRNYFVPLGDQIGQSAGLQVDCLEEIGAYFRNPELQLWEMCNGYALAKEDGLRHINQVIGSLSPTEYEALKDKLKVGIQWDTEVTLDNRKQLVTQVYCSALPLGYSRVPEDLWEPFAVLVLEATYEATFYTALMNYERTGNPNLLLTLVGGGAFKNRPEWIQQAIEKACVKFAKTPLEVGMVIYKG